MRLLSELAARMADRGGGRRLADSQASGQMLRQAARSLPKIRTMGEGELMNATSSWVGDVLTRFNLIRNLNDDSRVNRNWSMIDRTSLIERVYGACQAINSCAQNGLLYGKMFARPHAIAFRVGFVRGDIEYLMSLTMSGGRPTLLFSSRKEYQWKKSVLPFFRHSMNRRESFICRRGINPATVSDGEIQKWFIYLLSGLKRSFRPKENPSPQQIIDLSRAYSSQGTMSL
ncbi:MAG: hypothetical protein ACLQVG_06805 [Terriglobia bacterium]